MNSYVRSHDHRRHCPGAPQAEEWNFYQKRLGEELKRTADPGPARAKADLAWTVMLHKQGLIETETARRLLQVLTVEGAGGEPLLKQKLNGDEDTASAVNLGRTLQEPMSRLALREKLLQILDLVLATQEVLLDTAATNIDTVMAGQTHLSHAQPTTYGTYLIAVHDGLRRGREQLELAYAHTNECSGGCGACSGTGWDVDRQLVSDLLGFDSLVESAYDCEPGQDHALTILFAITNISVLLTRTAMDFNIWGMEEVGMVDVAPEWRGVSSLMPQKAIPGSQYERIRIEASDVIGDMITGIVSNKGEPYSDMLPIYEGWRAALRAMCHVEKALGFLKGILPATTPQRDRMRDYVREGYSATPDLAVFLIREKGYGSRRAHRICSTFVRMARERGMKACDTTGELLDAAAALVDEKQPGLTDANVREMLDPEKFLGRHNNTGDPNPDETTRMIDARRYALTAARQKHAERITALQQADCQLQAAVERILRE